MSRLPVIDPAQATDHTKTLLDQVNAKLGVTPNMMRTMANSPAVLGGYLAFGQALEEGQLSPKLREQIALAVAEANRCEYCLSAHSVLGGMVGLTGEEIDGSRNQVASDPETTVALRFATEIVRNRGDVSDAALSRLRQAGYNDAEIAEIVANVALNVFTNYFNLVALPPVDFPIVTPVAGH